MLRARPQHLYLFSGRSRPIGSSLIVAYLPGSVVIHNTDLASFS
jgi:hypothetical protein